LPRRCYFGGIRRGLKEEGGRMNFGCGFKSPLRVLTHCGFKFAT